MTAAPRLASSGFDTPLGAPTCVLGLAAIALILAIGASPAAP